MSGDRLVDTALKALSEIAADKKAPAAARASAARSLLEYKGKIGAKGEPDQDRQDKPISAMSLEEIQAELAKTQ